MMISHVSMIKAIETCGHLWMTTRDLYLEKGGDDDGYEDLLAADRSLELYSLFTEALVGLRAVVSYRRVVFDLAHSQYLETRNGIQAGGLVAFWISSGECEYAIEIADLYKQHLIEEAMRKGWSIQNHPLWLVLPTTILDQARSPLYDDL
jgi:hypothetical protein